VEQHLPIAQTAGAPPLFRGNTSVATGSCSRGPTDESGHAVIEWHVKVFFRWRVFF